MILNNYRLASDAAHAMMEAFLGELRKHSEKVFRMALSGGASPTVLFDMWANEFAELTPWEKIHFYWVDERCVPASSLESNYGMAKRLLFDPVGVDESHIHPIIGNNEPHEEAKRYSELVKTELPLENGVPVFDFVWLGIGDDGHVSSIFPGQEELLHVSEPYVVSVNPYSNQQRIAMTGNPMIKAVHSWFFVTGKDKADILQKLSNQDTAKEYPSGYVIWNARDTELFTAL